MSNNATTNYLYIKYLEDTIIKRGSQIKNWFAHATSAYLTTSLII